MVLEDIDETILGRARHAIGHATVVCFLGFAYDPDNLDKLDVRKTLQHKGSRYVFGSAYGLDTGEQQRVLERMPNSRMELGGTDDDCSKVLTKFHVFRD